MWPQTRKIFWNDPYCTEWKSIVNAQQGNQVSLEETIFYAFSGGQESDQGTLNELPILEAQKEDRSIIYTLPEEHSLKEGDEVLIKIDWNRRYALMRLHFAAELVLELVCQRFPKIERIGAHISQDKARIDFIWEESLKPVLPELQELAQTWVSKDAPIISAFSDEALHRRYWKVEGLAQVPCGGTHLKRTSEVGKISLKRKNPGKGKERIEMTIH